MAKRLQILILPDQDFARLEEIAEHGTVEGRDDLLTIVQYLATAISNVAQGQKDLARALQEVADLS